MWEWENPRNEKVQDGIVQEFLRNWVLSLSKEMQVCAWSERAE